MFPQSIPHLTRSFHLDAKPTDNFFLKSWLQKHLWSQGSHYRTCELAAATNNMQTVHTESTSLRDLLLTKILDLWHFHSACPVRVRRMKTFTPTALSLRLSFRSWRSSLYEMYGTAGRLQKDKTEWIIWLKFQSSSLDNNTLL